ncbi:hypothetical protein [Dyella acidisoli]|uniref:hypothetical protein n=1 Tax=Dyella acidisoli TaxID=1867834 RepID=UPI0024E0AD7B|nr:hypothetical protein [Dyella acidisoli]
MQVRPWMAATALWVAVCGWSNPVESRDQIHELPTRSSEASSFRCSAQACAMLTENTYPFLVIGFYQITATAEQTVAMYLVLGHLLVDAAQEQHFGDGCASPTEGVLQHSLVAQAKANAGRDARQNSVSGDSTVLAARPSDNDTHGRREGLQKS